MISIVIPLLILATAASVGIVVYLTMHVTWPVLERSLHQLTHRSRHVDRQALAAVRGAKPDPFESMAAAAGFPFGWHGAQWQTALIIGTLVLAVWGFWSDDPLRALLYAAAWPALIMSGLNRWAKVHAARRTQEAEDFLVGLEVLLQGMDVQQALRELTYTCPLLAPALERAWRSYGFDKVEALAKLADEAPELESAVAVLQQAIANSRTEVGASIRQEVSRMQHIREATYEAQMDVQAQLFKLTIIPPGITLIRVLFGLIWHLTQAQFFRI
jgi:hypothetical protein